jgi:hypothetical protein
MSASMREVRIRESHDCDKIHPQMNHLEWVAQNKDAANQDKDPVGAQHEEVLVEDMSLAPKGKGRKAAKALYKEDEKEETEWAKSKKQDREAQKRSEKQHDEREARYQRQKASAKKEEVEEGNLPPHLAKFFDKKGNLNPDAAKRMAAGKVKRKSKDVTPKGYGPNEEVEVDIVEVLRGTTGYLKKKGNPNYNKHKAQKKAAKADATGKYRPNSKDAPLNQHAKGTGWNRFGEVGETLGLGGWKGSGMEKMPPVDKKTGKYVTGKTKIIRLPKKEEVEVDEQEMMQLKHKKSGQVMRMANKVYQKQAHTQRKRGWVPDTKQPHMRGGSALQHSYEPEGDTELQEMDFKVKIKGLPIFYVPGRSVGEIRAHMRKNLKRPQDVEWVERTTVAQKKKDFRLRAQDKDSG